MPYKNLVFEGGGSAGIAYIGALKKLEDLEQQGKFSFKNIERVAGASVGSITALMVALNYNADEIYQILGNYNFTSFEDSKFGIIGDIVRLNDDYGVFDPSFLLKIIQDCIKEKTGNVNSTFGDFKKLGFKDLYVVATKVYFRDGSGACESVVFSAENALNSPVAPIILASASVPGVFSCTRLDEVGPGYYKYVKSKTAHAYIDAGVLDNIPEEVFDHSRYLSAETKTKDSDTYNPETLGMCLVNQPQLKDLAEHKPTIAPIPSDSPVKYIVALVNGCTLGQQNILFRKNHDEKRTIFIDRVGVSATASVNSKTKEKLVGSGDTGVSEFFNVKPTPEETTQSLAQAFAKKRVPSCTLFAKTPAKAAPKKTEEPNPGCSRMCTIL